MLGSIAANVNWEGGSAVRVAGVRASARPVRDRMKQDPQKKYPGLDHLRELTGEWIEELARVGYRGERYDTKATTIRETRTPFSSGSARRRHEVYPVRSETMQQTFWLRFGNPAESDGGGYANVEVSDTSSSTDTAIIAALISLEGYPMDAGRLRETLTRLVYSSEPVVDERGRLSIPLRRRAGERLPHVLRDPRQRCFLEFVLLLLRHHRPGFESLAAQEKAALMAETCCYINEFLEALRRLLAFLEHGTPGRGGVAATRLAGRAVRAAVLRDIRGLTNREIGEDLGVSPPDDFWLKGDHPTVRKMVGRGR